MLDSNKQKKPYESPENKLKSLIGIMVSPTKKNFLMEVSLKKFKYITLCVVKATRGKDYDSSPHGFIDAKFDWEVTTVTHLTDKQITVVRSEVNADYIVYSDNNQIKPLATHCPLTFMNIVRAKVVSMFNRFHSLLRIYD